MEGGNCNFDFFGSDLGYRSNKTGPIRLVADKKGTVLVQKRMTWPEEP